MSSQVFDVVQYGAVGNGVADDYPAITAAYDALVAAGGGELWFPPDRRYHVRSTGVHGLHLVRQSDATIRMGERAWLVMDNMVDGLAVSHGIFVEGPAANIALIGVQVRYAALSTARQGWAPIYFLGANVGTGDSVARPHGWYRGNPDGTEAWPQIEAGAVRDVRLENVTVEDSPSVGIGIVGVDGIELSNVTVRRTWADGLYHLYFRNARIDGFRGIEVGDDAISMASYESDLERADIDLPFHGEGSVVTDIVIEGRGPDRDLPCGSIVPLGVRDVTIAGFVIADRFRGLRFEPGTQRTLDHPTLNFNFLASRNVVIRDGEIRGAVQAISLVAKECNFATPRKWWDHDVTIANVALRGGSAPFDCWGTGASQGGGPAIALFGGFHFRGITCTGFTSPHTTLAGLHDCSFTGMEIDSPLAIHGSVPYGNDPDRLDGDGKPMWPDNRCTFRGIRSAAIVFRGLKRCLVEDLQSVDAASRGVTLSTCADIELRDVRVLDLNRTDGARDGAGIHIDAFCKRITGRV
jgi:polygalacturonase